MSKYRFKIAVFLVIGALLYIFYNSFYVYKQSSLSINEHVFEVTLVETLIELELGLSGRESIADNEAMLFVFSGKEKRIFWMKDMNFNIDLLWIEDDSIVAYEKNMLAPAEDLDTSLLPKYYSPQLIDKVLEIKAGLIDSLGIKVGDRINFKNI